MISGYAFFVGTFYMMINALGHEENGMIDFAFVDVPLMVIWLFELIAFDVPVYLKHMYFPLVFFLCWFLYGVLHEKNMYNEHFVWKLSPIKVIASAAAHVFLIIPVFYSLSFGISRKTKRERWSISDTNGEREKAEIVISSNVTAVEIKPFVLKDELLADTPAHS